MLVQELFCGVFFPEGRRCAFGVLKSCIHCKLLFPLEVKKIYVQKNYVTIFPWLKRETKMANSWICPYWFFKAETVTTPGDLEESNFCVVPKVFGLVWIVLCDWGSYRQEKDHGHFKTGKFLWWFLLLLTKGFEAVLATELVCTLKALGKRQLGPQIVPDIFVQFKSYLILMESWEKAFYLFWGSNQ